MLPILRRKPDGPPVRHISEYPRMTSEPLVVGKGPSISYSDNWTGPTVSVNEAIEYTGRGIAVRYDDDKRFRMFPRGLPNGTTMITHPGCVRLHPWNVTYVVGWTDLGLAGAIPTSMMAICIAAYLWDGPITVCGLDMLTSGSSDYAIVNAMVDSMQPIRLKDQLIRYREIPTAVLERTFSTDGRSLKKILADDRGI